MCRLVLPWFISEIRALRLGVACAFGLERSTSQVLRFYFYLQRINFLHFKEIQAQSLQNKNKIYQRLPRGESFRRSSARFDVENINMVSCPMIVCPDGAQQRGH